jgi:hypothetical protein
MRAQDVLERLGPVDEPLGGPAHVWLRQLAGVARALHLDPDLVQLLGARVLRQLLDGSAQLLELGGRAVGERDFLRPIGRSGEDGVEPREEPAVAPTVQRRTEFQDGASAVVRDGLHQPLTGGAAARGPAAELGSQLRAQHVQVANLPERDPEPLQLPTEALDPIVVEERAARPQDGAEPAYRHAHPVDGLGIAGAMPIRPVGADGVGLRSHRRHDVIEAGVARHPSTPPRCSRGPCPSMVQGGPSRNRGAISGPVVSVVRSA